MLLAVQASISALTCCVEQPKGVRLVADVEGDGVVVKHRGHVLGGELVGGVGDEQAGLAHGPVPHHHTFDGVHAASSDLRREVCTLIQWNQKK